MPFCSFADCFANYDKPWKLREHELKHTGERPFVCSVEGCGKSYCRSAHLSRHVKSHSGQKDYVCLQDGCKHRFVSAENLKKHLKRFHKQSHRCDFEGCGETFRKRQQLKVHQVTHTGINPYQCDVEGCGMHFALPSKLKRHMQKHEGRNCPKDGCDEIFKSWSLLRKHMSTDHVEVKCEICGKAFKNKHKLRLHKRVHREKVDVFLCPREGCNRTYTRMSYLQMHINNYHEGARPFACNHENCTKTFAYKVSLEKHQIVHGPGYVKPQPKPRKHRSAASKISGVVSYIKKPETETSIQCISPVKEDCNVEGHQEITCIDYTSQEEDVLNNQKVDMNGSEPTSQIKDVKLESSYEDNQLKSLPTENGSDKIMDTSYKTSMQEYKSNSLALTILESIECQ